MDDSDVDEFDSEMFGGNSFGSGQLDNSSFEMVNSTVASLLSVHATADRWANLSMDSQSGSEDPRLYNPTRNLLPPAQLSKLAAAGASPLDMKKFCDALQALPVFKTEAMKNPEHFDHGLGHHVHLHPNLLHHHALDGSLLQKAVLQGNSGFKIPGTNPAAGGHASSLAWLQAATHSPVQRFQYVLNAATSPATKIGEETLTYLNQGQSYEVKLNRIGDLGELEGKLVKSILRVVFHERRLQFIEREQLEFWKQARPGERVIDLDVPLSYGITDVVVDRTKLNSVEFKWDPVKDAGVFFKVHCISTEFTAKKHGGEKGVPFRVQMETYILDSHNIQHLAHAGSCQVKVFKPKGADRKHKTDREKVEKKPASEQGKYQPSYECTVLSELPLDNIRSYLEQSEKVVTTIPKQEVKSEDPKKRRGDSLPNIPSNSSIKSERKKEEEEADMNSSSSSSSDESALLTPAASEPVLSRMINIAPPSSAAASDQSRMGHLSGGNEQHMLPSFTATQVRQWLMDNRFGSYVKVFQNFSGADILKLAREDLIQICGLADGIRLNNSLQAKTVRPKLSLFVSQSAIHRPDPSRPQPLVLTNGTSNRVTSSTPATIASSTSSSPKMSASIPVFPQQHKVPASSPIEKGPPPAHHASLMQLLQMPISSGGAPTGVIRQGQKGRGDAPHTGNSSQSFKRFRDFQDEEDAVEYESPYVSSKKAKTRKLSLRNMGVFYAVYLEQLSVADLREKLAALYCVPNNQLGDIQIQMPPDDIRVCATDKVVQNIEDHRKYYLDAEQDEDSNLYTVHMTLVPPEDVAFTCG